jgi:outer membrane protein TolC
MDRAGPPRPPRLRRLRRLASGLCAAGAPWLLLGCGAANPWRCESAATAPTHAAYAAAAPNQSGDIVPVAYADPQQAPQPSPSTPAPQVMPERVQEQTATHATAGKQVPITLDTVLRLADQQNAKLAAAREKVNESQLTACVAASCWLPKVYAGVAYYRHEGGIQDFQGNLIHSSTGSLYPGATIQGEIDLKEAAYQKVKYERDVWQNKAEASQLTYEQLLDAANTYVDLLTARRGEAVAEELRKFEEKLLPDLEKRAQTETVLGITLDNLKAALAARDYATSRLRQQGNAASAKLVYLLGLPPDTCLVPVDATLVPIDLVDVTPPVCDLVARALTNGPGVRELEGMVALISDALARSGGLQAMLPTLCLCVTEGAFGAGPGDDMRWDNRLDVGLNAKWELTALLTARKRREAGESSLRRAQLNQEDLRGRLTAGVQDAREAILHGKEQIGLAAEQVRHASDAYRESDRRLPFGKEEGKVTDSDVLQNILALEQAHASYINAISNYNKAQVRLMLLLGPDGKAGHCPHP